MNLGEDDIREFSELWQREFGERLSPEEARHHASRLLELYLLLARPPRGTVGESPPVEPASHHP